MTDWNPAIYSSKHAYVYHYGESLIDLLAPEAGERILDVGCGSGQLTAKIQEICGQAVGIDSSEEMIDDAKSKYPDIEFSVADASDFSVDQTFDAVFSNAALHWVMDYEGAIRSIYHSLKPGGRLVLEMDGKGNIQTIINQLRVSLKLRGFTEQAELALWYFPSIGEYTPLLEKQGFSVLLAQHYDRPTEMPSNESGIVDWLSMFAGAFFLGISENEQEIIKAEVQEKIRPYCYEESKWYADYKRLRIMAMKE
ncbi:methyltransferase domain-containing protein [Catalinimonas sp. 4WD22]|uniref:class I SAM-dependent methyltransferase n=1 Tax=Catalinimonas locisalis TaxID=3133978 RepID=UPI0031018282